MARPVKFMRQRCFLFFVFGILPSLLSAADERPNILWITSEGMTFPLQAAYYQCQQPEELYDTVNDPHEVRNLAQSEPGMLQIMRARLRSHVLETGDLGLIPETMMEAIDTDGRETLYSFGQSEANYPLERILDLAIKASNRDPANQPAFIEALQDKNPIIRYWGMVGLRMPWVSEGGIDALV